MKKTVSLLLLASLFICSSNVFAMDKGERAKKEEVIVGCEQVGKSCDKLEKKASSSGLVRDVIGGMAFGSIAAIGLSVATKFKAPSSVVFVTGYYGSLLSFLALANNSTSKKIDVQGILTFYFIYLPIVCCLGVAGIVPTGILVVDDIGKNFFSGNIGK